MGSWTLCRRSSIVEVQSRRVSPTPNSHLPSQIFQYITFFFFFSVSLVNHVIYEASAYVFHRVTHQNCLGNLKKCQCPILLAGQLDQILGSLFPNPQLPCALHLRKHQQWWEFLFPLTLDRVKGFHSFRFFLESMTQGVKSSAGASGGTEQRDSWK